VPVVDQAWARRNLTDTMSGAREALSALATVGDRTAVEAALASPDGPWPPALPARTRGDLELARGVLVTATLAPAHVSVPSSRSQDNEAAALLRDLAHAARLLLCAAVSA
jgi:hypothetical protein